MKKNLNIFNEYEKQVAKIDRIENRLQKIEEEFSALKSEKAKLQKDLRAETRTAAKMAEEIQNGWNQFGNLKKYQIEEKSEQKKEAPKSAPAEKPAQNSEQVKPAPQVQQASAPQPKPVQTQAPAQQARPVQNQAPKPQESKQSGFGSLFR